MNTIHFFYSFICSISRSLMRIHIFGWGFTWKCKRIYFLLISKHQIHQPVTVWTQCTCRLIFMLHKHQGLLLLFCFVPCFFWMKRVLLWLIAKYPKFSIFLVLFQQVTGCNYTFHALSRTTISLVGCYNEANKLEKSTLWNLLR